MLKFCLIFIEFRNKMSLRALRSPNLIFRSQRKKNRFTHRPYWLNISFVIDETMFLIFSRYKYQWAVIDIRNGAAERNAFWNFSDSSQGIKAFGEYVNKPRPWRRRRRRSFGRIVYEDEKHSVATFEQEFCLAWTQLRINRLRCRFLNFLKR